MLAPRSGQIFTAHESTAPFIKSFGQSILRAFLLRGRAGLSLKKIQFTVYF